MTENSGKSNLRSRWAKTGLWLFVWLGMVALGYWLVASLVGLPAPRLVESTAGSRGPVVLEFLAPVDAASFLARIDVQPAVEGTWQVEGNQAIFWPLTPFQGSVTYQIRLAAGVTDAAGRRRMREAARWDVTIRRPQVVFIGEMSVQPEVWKVNADGSNPVRLTDTGGTVYDFAVSPQGDRIAYSAGNPAGGFDLWFVDRDGQNAWKSVDCGADWCVQPTWSPDGRVAYIQKPAGTSAYWDSARVWLLDSESGEREPLFADETLPGLLPSWSPDGRRIAFYDPQAFGIRVLDLTSGENLLLPTLHEAAGTWSPDGARLIFVDSDNSAFRPLTALFEADFTSGAIRPLLTQADSHYEYGLPQPSADGARLAVSARPVEGQPGAQLWILAPDGTDVQPITADVTYTHARYQWNPAGGEVLYQRLELGTSNSVPEIWIWRQESGESLRLAENASQPVWLP